MIVKSAEFVKSAAKRKQYPEYQLPEIAFAGRSNVGKSSLINCLLNRKRLVKTSRTPGRTQLINFFKINDEFSFVDLPGYGYAKTPRKVRESWGHMVQDYLFERKNLLAVVLAMDIRRVPREEELSLIRLVESLNLESVLILTKADKLSKNKQNNQKRIYTEMLHTEKEKLLLFSAKTALGKENVWQALETVIGNAENGEVPR